MIDVNNIQLFWQAAVLALSVVNYIILLILLARSSRKWPPPEGNGLLPKGNPRP